MKFALYVVQYRAQHSFRLKLRDQLAKLGLQTIGGIMKKLVSYFVISAALFGSVGFVSSSFATDAKQAQQKSNSVRKVNNDFKNESNDFKNKRAINPEFRNSKLERQERQRVQKTEK
jgi:hypothetical protein